MIRYSTTSHSDGTGKEEDVIHAAKVANAHEFIMQTDNGYQTLIGERGSNFPEDNDSV
jgi:subfamily B ATP-binding cassette protein MsbA